MRGTAERWRRKRSRRKYDSDTSQEGRKHERQERTGEESKDVRETSTKKRRFVDYRRVTRRH